MVARKMGNTDWSSLHHVICITKKKAISLRICVAWATYRWASFTKRMEKGAGPCSPKGDVYLH
jgi:hypothetical protein